jgi:hypothetical protein
VDRFFGAESDEKIEDPFVFTFGLGAVTVMLSMERRYGIDESFPGPSR